MSEPRILDAHCHIYPEKIATRAVAGTGSFYGGHTLFKRYFGQDGQSMCAGTAADLLQRGTAAGTEHFVVQSVATSARQVRSINEFIADEVEKSGGRFTGLGTLYPDSPDLMGDYAHLRGLGLQGVKLHPDIQRFKIDDYRCLKIYELCEQDGLPILMHTGDSRFDYSNPNRLLPVMRIYTRLTVVGAHLGGWSVWDEASQTLGGLPNLYFDCSSCLPFIGPERVWKLIRHYGASRVLYGTDYPMWEPDKELTAFWQMGLTDEERRSILWNNAARIYGID